MTDIISYLIQGFFISVGTAVGSYLANKAILHNIEKIVKKLGKEEQIKA